jgi:DNA-binding transcriptional MerR regulator
VTLPVKEPGRALRPVDLGRAIGLSGQMANRYEQWGLLPPAERSPTGRRCYGPQHLRAILALRAMQDGYGWKPANQIMRLVHQGDLAGALASVDDRHAALHRQRQEVEATLRVLQTLGDAVSAAPLPRRGRARGSDTPAGRDGAQTGRWRTRPDLLRIGEAARLTGVRPSAIRFWEEQGLLRPPRDDESGFRVYDEAQLVRLRIVAVLRQASYTFAAIRAVLDELAGGRPSTALTAIQRRRDDLTRASERCTRATAAFWAYVAEMIE